MIRFYRPDEAYGWMSNFYGAAPLTYEGELYITSEHLYQALKVAWLSGEEAAEDVRLSKTPRLAKDRAHELIDAYCAESGNLDEISIVVKADLMRTTLKCKFDTWGDLRQRLMGCDDHIVEAAPKDSIWGTGPSGRGLNLMGLLLMEERAIRLGGGIRNG